MEKELIKKAFESAEKEAQEKQVEFIKKIVQKHLERIDGLTKSKEELDEEIRLLKKDLEDLKAGRLDKIEERQKVDERARGLSIIIIKKIEREYIPLAPWRSPWDIVWNVPNNSWATYSVGAGGTFTTTCLTSGTGVTGTSNVTSTSGTGTLTTLGTTVSNFAGGAYLVGDKIINF
jgi:hypothetical protein